jgi:hypothetical protein
VLDDHMEHRRFEADQATSLDRGQSAERCPYGATDVIERAMQIGRPPPLLARQPAVVQDDDARAEQLPGAGPGPPVHHW